MKLVITGGAGFFGFHISRAFPNADLVLLDLEGIPDSELPSEARTVERVQADVRNRTALREAFANADAIIHAAAALPLWKATEIRSVNLDGTRAVLEVAKEVGVPRVVHISSTAVYGIPDHHPLNEEDALHGVGPYGESKVSAESLCEKAREAGLCVPVLRPKTFIGPERLGVFQILFEWIREGRRIPVIGDGQNRYQLLDVSDAAQAVRILVEADSDSANQAFNVGALEFNTVAEDMGTLFEHASSGSRLMTTPAWLAKSALAILGFFHLSPLYKWVWGTADQDSWVDCNKLQGLGWKPQYSNAETLVRTWDWYLENREKMSESGKGHRVPWSEGALSVLRRFL